ncbi:adenylate/guanylate cyclase domain-containing protein [Actinospongicola halichondriae]|uniref:adenylate/guanylate cyclase domain-containing protein n=1 Tax=Actinospongicola halichondriae TaxID=3236844 RepID=UPI003D4246E7
MGSIERAREEGQGVVGAIRRSLTERAASLLKEHPEFAEGAAEVGLVDKAWLDDPTGHPIRTATSLDVVQRFLERSVEREPSLIASMGLNAIQMLSMESESDDGGGQAHPMTIVFTDLEGFTRFTSREGDEAARALLDRHHKSVGPVIRSRGGRIVKKIGDGLLITFAAPEAAVLAAIEIGESDSGDLRLRAGIHHGEAVLMGDDLIGHDVNLAARVADSAKGGETLATTDVRSAVGPLANVRFGRARRRNFKGVTESVSVCPVTRAR